MIIGVASFSFDPMQIDKQAHEGYCYALSNICETKLEMNWWQSGLTVLAAGMLFEQVGQNCGRSPYDVEDVYADVLGWVGYRLVYEVKF